MSVFGIFISPTEFEFKQLMKNKPQQLYYVYKKEIEDTIQIPKAHNDIINKDITMCTSNKRKAMLHLFEPFFSFKFSNDGLGIIILGSDHDLLKLEKKIAYMYSIDSKEFMPIVDEDGKYEELWYTENDVTVFNDNEHKRIKMLDLLKSGIQIFWIDTIDTLKQIDDEMESINIKDGDAKLEYLINQTNWKSDKVIYMNRYKNIGVAIKEDSGYVVDMSKHKKKDSV